VAYRLGANNRHDKPSSSNALRCVHNRANHLGRKAVSPLSDAFTFSTFKVMFELGFLAPNELSDEAVEDSSKRITVVGRSTISHFGKSCIRKGV